MKASVRGFSVPFYPTSFIRIKIPNWQEGWPEGYLHQRDRRADYSN